MSLRRDSKSKQDSQDHLSERSNAIQQLQIILVEKLRLEEVVDFMKEEAEKTIQELNVHKSRADILEKELKEVQSVMVLNQSQAQTFHFQSKRIEDQLKSSNFHFVNTQKKLSILEKENKELIERLQIVEVEKKKISLKWSAASQRVKTEEKLKSRIKELEIEINELKSECEEYKKKYVQSNTELRVYKDGEMNYKDIVEYRFKELKEMLISEQSQKEELLKQNSLLVQQLKEMASQVLSREEKVNEEQENQREEPSRESKKRNPCQYESQNNEESQEITQQHNAKQRRNKKQEVNQIEDLEEKEQEEKWQEIISNKDNQLFELSKLLNSSNEEIDSLKLQIANEIDLANFLKEEKLQAIQEVEELKDHNNQLRDRLSRTLQESQNELDLLEKVTSINISNEAQQEFSQICDLLLICQDRKLAEQIKIRVHCILQLIATSNSVCKDCSKQISGRAQLSLERQLSELRALYDRLLSKHSILQNKFTLLSIDSKNQLANAEINLKLKEPNLEELGKVEENYGMLENQFETEIQTSEFFKKTETNSSQNFYQGNLKADMKLNVSQNYSLIQSILKNGFALKDNLTQGSQKMLHSLFTKLIDTQSLQDQLNSTIQNKHLGSSQSFKTNSTGFKPLRSGPPSNTLDRSKLQRNKSKENYPISNGNSSFGNNQGGNFESNGDLKKKKVFGYANMKAKSDEFNRNIKSNMNQVSSQNQDQPTIFKNQACQLNNSFEIFESGQEDENNIIDCYAHQENNNVELSQMSRRFQFNQSLNQTNDSKKSE